MRWAPCGQGNEWVQGALDFDTFAEMLGLAEGISLRIIRSRLGKEEQMKFDAHAGIREFKKLMP